ncbi:MAG: thioesterase domain-containing protein [Tepidisphaerales bacterium]
MALAWLAGCSSHTRPGDLDRVQPVSDTARIGNAYLFRGWIGIFSAGIDQLGAKLNDAGVRATVYQESQWRDVARQIRRRYNAESVAQREPIVLIGHSYGADAALRIAEQLDAHGIPVDLIITLDPVTPPRVTGNVRRVYNLYQSNGMLDAFPWLRGIPLEAAPGAKVEIQNMDIRRDRTDLLVRGLDHFNIEKQPGIHDDVLQQVLTVCVPRFVPRYAAERPSGPAQTPPTP